MNSKQKGAGYERAICKQLSLWVSNGKSTDLFWRSAMSGGRATVAFQRGEKLSRQAGDICAVAPEGHALTSRFYIELKHVRSLDLEAFFLTGKGKLGKFWQVAVREAAKHDRQPLIIARQNRVPDLFICGLAAVRDISELEDSMLVIVSNAKFSCEVRLLAEVLKVPFLDW